MELWVLDTLLPFAQVARFEGASVAMKALPRDEDIPLWLVLGIGAAAVRGSASAEALGITTIGPVRRDIRVRPCHPCRDT